jgi:predicted enzyme related to lactoylglutathione lyase
MERVTGIGGIFFKARDPAALGAWYERHLGVTITWPTGTVFAWEAPGSTVWSAFAAETTYFAPSTAPFMINYRVADLARMLEQLRAAGVEVDPKSGEDSEYGKFGWCMDPEGNRIELWEPPPGK